jgi:hypothetical protein
MSDEAQAQQQRAAAGMYAEPPQDAQTNKILNEQNKILYAIYNSLCEANSILKELKLNVIVKY